MSARPAIAAAIGAAALFGISTPAAKLLLGAVHPVLLAALLYLGAGLGLLLLDRLRRLTGHGRVGAPIVRADWPWLAGAIVAGGVAAPVALLYGLARTPASSAALLLNLEAVFTALLAWFVFHENADRRVALGLLFIVLGGALLAWDGSAPAGLAPGALLIVAACAGWALDNNLTHRLSGSDPMQVAGVKSLAAGSVSLALAWMVGAGGVGAAPVAASLLVGLFGYGISLSLFVWALRHLGTARTGAYFATAPFFGGGAALLLPGEAPGWPFWAAAAAMGAGVWLHLTERHGHLHAHQPQLHAHAHRHDEHHRHTHDFPWDGSEPHSHAHRHEPLVHSHPHYPDLHHRHRH